MPIEISTQIQPCDQEQFHALDRRIMRVVFDVHNEFGRLFDESLYKAEIAARCNAIGIKTEREVRIRVSHDSFDKGYLLDLLFCSGFMLEGKTAERLAGVHRGQSLHYLLLAGLNHSRLVNFRTERVQHEFVSTTLTLEERRRFIVVDDEWVEINEESYKLKSRTIELLEDWGAFLDVNLYRAALVHFLGGPSSVNQPVEIYSESRPLGKQNFNLLNEDTAFAFTTKHKDAGSMRDHLERLLRHTKLKAIQWINLNRHRVELTTLRQ
jgi:GxxExxY protein